MGERIDQNGEVQKARTGLMILRAGWLAELRDTDVRDALLEDVNHMTAPLKREFTLARIWVIDSEAVLSECLNEMHELKLDMLVLAFQTWADDRLVQILVSKLDGMPLALWCYLPWRRLPRPISTAEMLRGSGPAGMFGALEGLRQSGTAYFFTFGSPDDPRLVRDLCVAARAARTRRQLFSSRIGVLAQPGLVQDSLFVRGCGPQLVSIREETFREALSRVDTGRVQAAIAYLRNNNKVVIRDLKDSLLERAASASLALTDLVVDHRLDALALEPTDDWLESAAGVRVSLNPRLFVPSDCLFYPGAAPFAVTASLALSKLTGLPTFLFRVYFWDEARNQVIGGHPDLQDPFYAGQNILSIIPGQFGFRPANVIGAQADYIVENGRVTLFQLYLNGSTLTALAVSGICLESRPWVEGCPHAVLRLDPPIDHFIKHLASSGASAHWVMAYGSMLPELEALCQMCNIQFDVLS
jgi:hypothetical protein